MAFTEFYCTQSGSNLNAGSTEDDSPVHEYASGDWVQSTRVFTVASGNPVSDGVAVGDFASVYPDGSSVGVYLGRIVTVTSTTITIDSSVNAGAAPTNGTGNRTIRIGGAWEGPNGSETFPFGVFTSMQNEAGNYPRVNFKNGSTYNITASLSWNSSGLCTFQGYTTTPGDRGRAIIDGGTSGASYNLMTFGTLSDNTNLVDFIFQNNGATGLAEGIAFESGAKEMVCINVTVRDVRGWGFGNQASSDTLLMLDCEAYNCNQSNTAGDGGIQSSYGVFIRCVSHDNNRDGFVAGSTGGNSIFIDCIAYGNTECGWRDASHRGPVVLSNCLIYDNGQDGIEAGGSGAQQTPLVFDHCVIIDNGAWGIDLETNINICTTIIKGCAFHGNTSGQIDYAAEDPPLFEYDTLSLDDDPFVDAANADFNLNAVSGGGQDLRDVTIELPTT